jgi:streptomycin 6-kinase
LRLTIAAPLIPALGDRDTVTLTIPEQLVAADRMKAGRQEWLTRLRGIVRELQSAWSLELGPPFDGPDVSLAWVAPVLRKDGSHAVLKVGMPHMEGEQEAEGLRFWAGNPTVRLLEADEEQGAMLLERCEPGTSLRRLPEPDQDVVISRLLRRLWRVPPKSHGFRPLCAMARYWVDETKQAESQWPDAGLVREGLSLFEELSRPAPDDVLLATDLHAGNVLAAQREPWLVIDPKPFVGDRAYDATQHLLNCKPRVLAAPDATIDRLSDLLEMDGERIRLWLFARVASEPRDSWDEESIVLARMLS